MKVSRISVFILMVLSGFWSTALGQEYQESYRLQYHFSPLKNWINDPCGMVYLDGEYHLMYQYNPYGTQWGNMSWGHAVSKDLVHWEELPVALVPDELGAIFSGGAVIDYHNTAGFGDSAMVAVYTSAGSTQQQSIAYSLDKGRSWTKYAGNPVLTNQGTPDFRDPMVFWNQETAKWIMALAVLDRIEFYSSPDLKSWTFESDFGSETGAHGGVWECPDLFQLKVEGQPDSLWVLMVSLNPGSPSGGSGTQYFLGDFDGTAFTLTEEFDSLLNSEKILPDGVLFEDFEGADYAAWEVSGTAFGSGPAQGTLPDQQAVSGYLGQQLVNSYLQGDGSQGKLLSPLFTIETAYINFLIGGGNLPGQAEVRLIINGETVATATGRNEEKLRWQAWDVRSYAGAEARIEIIDAATEGWGHINVDHIYFSDEAILNDQVEALWTDYGPDFYAGRSWENQPAESAYQRVWLAWMNNWAYAGNLPTTSWRGSLSLPRSLELRENENGHIRLFQQPVHAFDSLRTEHVAYTEMGVEAINQQLEKDGIRGTRYEMSFTIVPGTTTGATGVELRKGISAKTVVGYDPARKAVYLDRSRAGHRVSDTYERVFYAPFEGKPTELRFRIFVDESSIEVFVNEGALVQTARIFPRATWDGLSFFGSAEVEIKAFDFWKMASIWPEEEEVLGLYPEKEEPWLRVYPNPNRGQFYIRSGEEIAAVAVFDARGAKLTTKVKMNVGNASVAVSGASQAGIHFVKIYFKNGQVIVKKLVLR
jgi:fructan beta-fructosidase